MLNLQGAVMKSRFLTSIVLVIITCYINAAAQTVYKKINTDGSVEYSDQAFAGASAIQITGQNQTQLPAPSAPVNFTKDPAATTLVPTPNYAIAIQAPQSGQSVRNNSGNLTIVVQTTPKLGKKLKVQLLINNSPLGEPKQQTVFKVKNINRGEVKIKTQLLNSLGNILATSSETVVYLHRVSIIRTN
jgi:hypothetical protein